MESFFLHLLREAGIDTGKVSATAVGGGCINQAAKISTDKGDTYFIKWQQSQQAKDMFTAEQKGLALLRQHFRGFVPEPIAQGVYEDKGWLLMEFVQSGPRSSRFWEDFGKQLANLHRQSATSFGLDHDNYIGSLPQQNNKHSNWPDFYIQERLRPQLAFAERRKLIDTKLQADFDRLFLKLPELMPAEAPALLHGDLWSGNFITGPQGQPCIMDPAVYYGHREMEIAFTKLFGGFDDTLYMVYQECFPLEAGAEQRVALCHLYPLLVHLNLFGSSYLPGLRRALTPYIN